MDTPIGISIGGANCCVGIYHIEQLTPELIFNERGTQFMPSYVAYTSDGGVLVGHDALDQQIDNPKNTFYDIKRFMGCKLDSSILQKRIKKWPFSLAYVNNKMCGVVEVKGERKLIEAEDIAALLIKKLKEIAEAFLGKPVQKAVLCVPPDTPDAGRQAMKDAGTRAGLYIMRTINEPTAATIAFGLERNSTRERKVIVCDMGRSMFDVTAFVIEDGIFEIVATASIEDAAGADLDKQLAEYFAQQHSLQLPLKDPRAMHRLYSVCEQAKIALSTAMETTIRFEVDGQQIASTVTRSQFEQLIRETLFVFVTSVKNALKDARWRTEDVQSVVLLGGGNAIPSVKEIIGELFPAVAPCGAASWSSREAVCQGASIQSAILSGSHCKPIHDVVLLDMTQASVLVTLADGQGRTLLPQGATVPCRTTTSFSTSRDFQTSINFCLYETKSEWQSKKLLAKTEIEGLPPLLKAMLKIDITVSIDVDYNLVISVDIGRMPGYSESQVVYNGKAEM